MSNQRPPPLPPRPQLLRRPHGAFGWLDARLLHDGWLPQIGADGVAVLAFFALAADGRGASYYGRARMASTLGVTEERLDHALDRLRRIGLVDFRPWRASHRDGVWQVLPVPGLDGDGESLPQPGLPQRRDRDRSQPEALRDIVERLGIR